MNRTKHILMVFVSLVFLLSVANSNALTAEEIVKETTLEVLARLQADQDKLKLQPEYIEIIVEELVVPHFDFVTMSRLVLAKHWQAINDAEQVCFTTGFRELLISRYADIFLAYKDQTIRYEPENSIGEVGYVSVRQIISHHVTDPFVVDYPMRPAGDGWMVVDLIVDDVSLLKVYRVTFKQKIQKLGLQNFLADFNQCDK